ncbi:hypothetical protein SEEA1981_19900, partial [Salmonella enterica subsp. enterica serovar Agona str. 241981]
AIDGGLTRDLYAAARGGAGQRRVGRAPVLQTVCPLDMAGGLLMALGGLLCLADPRYRRRKPLPEAG